MPSQFHTCHSAGSAVSFCCPSWLPSYPGCPFWHPGSGSVEPDRLASAGYARGVVIDCKIDTGIFPRGKVNRSGTQMIRFIRSVLAIPTAYQFWWNMVGGPAYAKVLVNEYAQPSVGARILEIGCGPGTIVRYLPPSEYLGFDLSPRYIELAKKRFPKARFVCERVSQFSLAKEQSFDVVLAHGIVHHLEDAEARQLFQIAFDALKTGRQAGYLRRRVDRRSVSRGAVVVDKRPGRVCKERAGIRGDRVSGIQQYQTKRPRRSLADSVYTPDSGMRPMMSSFTPSPAPGAEIELHAYRLLL